MFLDGTVQDLNEYIQMCTAELFFSLDELVFRTGKITKREKLSRRTDDDVRPDDMSFNISKGQIYFGNLSWLGY
jgi:hypothetical protein